MSDPVNASVQSGIALIELAAPPVNAITCEVREELLKIIKRFSADHGVRAVILTGAGKVFSVGADIREFASERWARHHLADVCEALEQYPGLLIMGLNGTALGGGLELALTADYRVAREGALIGLPEVRLGLIPGAGGTQRLPRIIDPRHALEIIATGDSISAREALDCGLVDHLVEADREFRNAVIQYAEALLGAHAPRRRCAERKPLPLAAEVLDEMDRRVSGDSPVRSARRGCFDMIRAACRLPLEEGLRLERSVFQGLMQTPEHRALRHIFLAERAALKVPGIGSGTAPRTVRRVGIVGAGTMGTGIALSFLAAGLQVTLVEASQDALAKGIRRIRTSISAAVERKRVDQGVADRQLDALRGSIRLRDLRDEDLVIEAVYEDYELKERVFRDLNEICREGCILASNTSTLDLNRIAACTSRESDVVGIHFFSPANVMRLLEVVRGKHTSADVIVTCQALAKRLGKIPVVVGVGFGFVGNRMMEPYIREAQRLVLEGASPSQVDGALSRFGMAMGPLAVLDLAGLDVTFRIRESRRCDIAADPSYAKLGDELYALGRFGQKSGRGYYRYEGRERKDDPEVVDLAEAIAGKLGIRRRIITEQEVVERCVYSLIDEGARVLEEGIAARASDCDVIYVYGYGFPAWRGGPMHYADELGAGHVNDAIERYRRALGAYGDQWFQGSQLLKRVAANRERFSAADIRAGEP